MKSLPKIWPEGSSSADWSPCKRYRYTLRRKLGPGTRAIAFIGLNPSTADEQRDDPTVERCVTRAMRWGYDVFYMLNAFAWRATDPRDMIAATDPIGEDNDRHILAVLESPSVAEVVLCWGVYGRVLDRSSRLLKLLEPHESRLRYLALTKQGEPGHPLYLSYKLELKAWTQRPDNSPPAANAAARAGRSAISRRRQKSRSLA